MTESRRRENGSANDRKWWHDTRILATALISTMPFIVGMGWQLVNLGSEWGAVRTRLASIEASVSARDPDSSRITRLESQFIDLKSSIDDVRAGQDRLIEFLMTDRRASADGGSVAR